MKRVRAPQRRRVLEQMWKKGWFTVDSLRYRSGHALPALHHTTQIEFNTPKSGVKRTRPMLLPPAKRAKAQ